MESKARIFSVTTAVGIIIRESKTKVYTHAILTDTNVISTWCSRLDLAQKAAGGSTYTKGGTIVEVVELDKRPADAYPGIKLEQGYKDDTSRIYIITDTDGKQYTGRYGEYESVTDAMAFTQLHKLDGYLDRLYTLYSFNRWKVAEVAKKADAAATQAAIKRVAKKAAADEAKAESDRVAKINQTKKTNAAHDLEVGNIKPGPGVSFHKHKHQWEVKPCIAGKRYFAGYYKKENLEAANQAAAAVKAAGAEKAQEVADHWKILRKDREL